MKLTQKITDSCLIEARLLADESDNAQAMLPMMLFYVTVLQRFMWRFIRTPLHDLAMSGGSKAHGAPNGTRAVYSDICWRDSRRI